MKIDLSIPILKSRVIIFSISSLKGRPIIFVTFVFAVSKYRRELTNQKGSTSIILPIPVIRGSANIFLSTTLVLLIIPYFSPANLPASVITSAVRRRTGREGTFLKYSLRPIFPSAILNYSNFAFSHTHLPRLSRLPYTARVGQASRGVLKLASTWALAKTGTSMMISRPPRQHLKNYHF